MKAERQLRRYLQVARVFATLAAILVLAPLADAQTSIPEALPNWPSSPYHGVTGGNGEIIPCRCRFAGHLYMLGEEVCMETHVGTVQTRCDLVLNNTSWVPTSTPCRISRRSHPLGRKALALALPR